MESRRLFIGITKTRLKRISIEYKEDGTCEVYATVALCTEGGREVTDHTCQTNHWEKEKALKLDSRFQQVAMIAGQMVHEAAEKTVMQLDGLIDPPAASELPF